MKESIFRKSALARLESPEQLDQLLETTVASHWLLLAAVTLLLGAVIFWGFEGKILTKASGAGLLVRRGGLLNIDALGTGVVTRMLFASGDHVKKGQMVAQVAQPELTQRIKDTRALLREAQNREAIAIDVHRRSARLQESALQRQRENAAVRISVLEERSKILRQQIAGQQELADSGLVTKYQVLEYKAKLVDTQDQIATGEAAMKSLEAQQFAAASEPAETDQELRAKVLELEASLRGMQQQADTASQVFAPMGGQIIETKVSPGSLVNEGTPLLSLQPEEQTLEVIAYIDSLQAKNIRVGMSAQISPSTVRREEFGFLRGTAIAVADFPATPEAIEHNFANRALVDNILHNGPVTEVRVRLWIDRASQSGFAWSSLRDPGVTLSSGTLCTVDVVTKQQRPIALLLPWARDSIGLE